MTRRRIDYVFRFPPIHGIYDTGEGIVYIFGEQHEDEIEDVFSHEDLHYAIQRVARKRASLKLDKIEGAVKRRLGIKL